MSEFGPVAPSNLGGRRRGRRDPDAIPEQAAPEVATPPPAAAVPTPAPEPAPDPAPAPAPVAGDAPARPARQPAVRAPRNAAARVQQGATEDVSLETVLARQPASVDGDGGINSLSVTDMLRLRRKRVDPMNDYRADGTRQLVWVQDAIALVSDLTKQTQQEVLRDAVLGIHPIPKSVLDQCFAERYGYPRPKDAM